MYISFPTYLLNCFPFAFPSSSPVICLSPSIYSYTLNVPVRCLNPFFSTIVFVIYFRNYQNSLLHFSPFSVLDCFSFISTSRYPSSFIFLILFPSFIILSPSFPLYLSVTHSHNLKLT